MAEVNRLKKNKDFARYSIKIRRRIILLSLLLSVNIFSQQTTFQDSLLDRMTGKWTLKGIIAGQETTHDVTASWILEHQYLQFREISHEKDADGTAAYEALVFIGWDSQLNQYSCLWLDVTGGGLSAQAIAHAERKGDDIAFLFKGSDGSLFHTTFVYDRNVDTWQWIMDGEENGTLQPFARVKLTRKE
ncbi:MAG: hypothetical protein AB1521_03570 [Bacteroidota bacterium]